MIDLRTYIVRLHDSPVMRLTLPFYMNAQKTAYHIMLGEKPDNPLVSWEWIIEGKNRLWTIE